MGTGDTAQWIPAQADRGHIMHETEAIRISDTEIDALPLPMVIDAVTEALCALRRGEIDNSPRSETLGREGDPDFFRLELEATWRIDGKPRWHCRKIIEEVGTQDTFGNRALGTRKAWIELRDFVRNRVVTLDAEVVTNVRTGIAAVLAAKWLSPRPPRTVALIGTGRIAGACARAATYVFDVSELSVTSRTTQNRERFAQHFSSELGLPIRACESLRECVRGADVVIAAVPSREPVVVSDDVCDVPQITLVGGDPRVVLADREAFTRRRVLVDSFEQALRTGDFLRARDEGWIDDVRWTEIDGRPATLSDIALRQHISSCGEMTTCVLTGIGALDLAVARLAWEQRIASGNVTE